MAFGQAVEQALGFLPAEKLVGVLLDHFGEVRGEHAGLVNDGVAGSQGLVLQRGSDPHGGDSEGRLLGG